MSPDGMIAAANKLVFDHKVKFMIGGVPIPVLEVAIWKILQENKVLTMNIDSIGVKSDLTPQFSYSFRTMVTRAAYDVSWENFMKLYPKVKTIAIMPPEDPAAVEDAQNLGEAAKAHGLKVVAVERYPFGTSDFYPTWTKVLAAKPDAVATGASLPEWLGGIVKQGRELGFKGPFAFLTPGADAHVIAKIAGDAYATDVFATSMDFTSPTMPSMVKEIGRVVKQNIGVEMTVDYFMAFEALWILSQAIEHAQSVDPTVVRDAFEKMTKIDTPTGPGRLAGLKTYGINHLVLKPFPIMRMMNGKIEHIGWFDAVMP